MRVDVSATFPDFFLVGAPRCGTTSLAKYLRRHPSICFSKPKEPHFFTRPAAELDAADIERDYVERFFWRRRLAHRIAGEGSVSYLYSADALRRILTLKPDARFLVMVRNPLQMLASYHARMVFLLQESEPDIARAFALCDARARGESIPERCIDPNLLQYREVARLGAHVAALFELVGRSRCHVVVYDDFARDPAAVYVEVLKFLGVEDDGRTEFPTKQPSREWRWLWLHRLLYQPPLHLLRFVERAGRRAAEARSKRKPWWKRMHKQLVAWNTTVRKPAPIPIALRERLCGELADDVALLGRLLGRDLSGWLA
jgi:hypothetical protein